MAIGFALFGRFFRGFTTPLMWLWGAAAGAVVMAAIEIGVNARYMWANHTEAKRHRQREAERKPPQR